MSKNTGTLLKETTFRSFDSNQGAKYAQHRPTYHPRLYNHVLGYHKSTGGQFDTLLDVGCGPGTALRDLAPQFAHAIGLDASEGMVATARSLGGVSSTSEPIRFEVSTIEEAGSRLSPPIPDSSVDLLVAATAAHWFDMAVFWPQAARLLRPGGTVALWCGGVILVDPSLPQGRAIQDAIDRFHQALDHYMAPGNRIATGLYRDLQLPWMLEKPVPEFDRASFLRKEWNIGEGFEPIDEFYNTGSLPADAYPLVSVLATTSPYVRWREANADAVGTEKDPLEILRRELEPLFHELKQTGTPLKGGVGGALLMVKKKAE
ncbi:hypothetical protein VTK56DRAFT_3593 [Thermocarpiscus australiensis]